MTAGHNDSQLLLRRNDRYAVIELNHPEKRNALNLGTLSEFGRHPRSATRLRRVGPDGSRRDSILVRRRSDRAGESPRCDIRGSGPARQLLVRNPRTDNAALCGFRGSSEHHRGQTAPVCDLQRRLDDRQHGEVIYSRGRERWLRTRRWAHSGQQLRARSGIRDGDLRHAGDNDRRARCPSWSVNCAPSCQHLARLVLLDVQDARTATSWKLIKNAGNGTRTPDLCGRCSSSRLCQEGPSRDGRHGVVGQYRLRLAERHDGPPPGRDRHNDPQAKAAESRGDT